MIRGETYTAGVEMAQDIANFFFRETADNSCPACLTRLYGFCPLVCLDSQSDCDVDRFRRKLKDLYQGM